jgi:hypothetical protein
VDVGVALVILNIVGAVVALIVLAEIPEINCIPILKMDIDLKAQEPLCTAVGNTE